MIWVEAVIAVWLFVVVLLIVVFTRH